MESLSEISDGGSVLFSLLASFFILLQLVGKIIGTLVSFSESL